MIDDPPHDTRVCVCVSAVGSVVVAVAVCVCLYVCACLDHETSTFSRAFRRMLCSSDAEVVLYWNNIYTLRYI